jgi:hypothetical protein
VLQPGRAFAQERYPVGELFKDYVGSKKTSEFRTRRSTLDSLQISPRDL